MRSCASALLICLGSVVSFLLMSGGCVANILLCFLSARYF